jgi:micrococcal nuclease
MMEQYYYRATVKRVIDGDTVVMDVDLGFNTVIHDEHFRLFGIDAPETRTKDLEEKRQGILSKERLEELCPVGEKFLIRTEKSKDKYGRYLVRIYPRGSHLPSVNDILLKESLAKVYMSK